jgi:hypothetical protein
MAKAVGKIIETMAAAIAAYGGPQKFAQAFGIDAEDLTQWKKFGPPANHTLALFVGLLLRGFTPAPGVFKLKRWEDLVGV